MNTYHKIQTVFKRDQENNFKALLEGQFSLPEFEFLQDNTWVFTEKVDGTNIRIMWEDNKLKFGGKTDSAQIPATLAEELINMFDKGAMEDLFPEGPVCLYGEGYGPQIQKGGGNYRDNQSFVLFDVKVGRWWLKREGVEDVAHQLGLDRVPIIGSGTLGDLVEKCRAGFNSQWGNFEAEGIVARPQTELCTRGGSRIITKLKIRDFK